MKYSIRNIALRFMLAAASLHIAVEASAQQFGGSGGAAPSGVGKAMSQATLGPDSNVQTASLNKEMNTLRDQLKALQGQVSAAAAESAKVRAEAALNKANVLFLMNTMNQHAQAIDAGFGRHVAIQIKMGTDGTLARQ